MVWAVIFGMGAIVFLNRYLFLEPRLPIRLGSNLRQFLGFAVPGMLVLYTRNTLASMLLGMAFFFLFKWWLI